MFQVFYSGTYNVMILISVVVASFPILCIIPYQQCRVVYTVDETIKYE